VVLQGMKEALQVLDVDMHLDSHFQGIQVGVEVGDGHLDSQDDLDGQDVLGDQDVLVGLDALVELDILGDLDDLGVLDDLDILVGLGVLDGGGSHGWHDFFQHVEIHLDNLEDCQGIQEMGLKVGDDQMGQEM